VSRLIPLRADAEACWRMTIEDRALTGRGAARIRRVARTLADLDDTADVTPEHLDSAAFLRADVP
jgi:predicted ATPase with chaperone activity